jgi:hypothetical protein
MELIIRREEYYFFVVGIVLIQRYRNSIIPKNTNKKFLCVVIIFERNLISDIIIKYNFLLLEYRAKRYCTNYLLYNTTVSERLCALRKFCITFSTLDFINICVCKVDYDLSFLPYC